MACKCSGAWTKSSGPCIYVGDPEEAPGPWLQISSPLAIAATGGMKQEMEDFSISPSFCKSSFKNKNKNKNKNIFKNKSQLWLYCLQQNIIFSFDQQLFHI